MRSASSGSEAIRALVSSSGVSADAELGVVTINRIRDAQMSRAGDIRTFL
jgi:hypothetical protein